MPKLGDLSPHRVRITAEDDAWHRVAITWNVPRRIAQDELAVEFDLLFGPDFHWLPHLTPADGFVVGQHVFRAPAVIAAKDSLVLAIVPDVDLVGRRPDNPWFMDLDAVRQKAWIGMTPTDIPVHVGFRKRPGMTIEPGQLTLAFLVTAYEDEARPVNPWRRVSSLLDHRRRPT